MLDREERLNDEEGVGSKGCGKDGEGVNGESGEEGCNGSMRTSELGRGEGPDGGVVAWPVAARIPQPPRPSESVADGIEEADLLASASSSALSARRRMTAAGDSRVCTRAST
eukprot:4038634-Pleurochrysis_carterae.AAC.2